MMGSNKKLAVYLRISKDDGRFGESQSIENQRKLINDYIANTPDLCGKEIVEFVDDGYTGVNFNRPSATQMLALAKSGEIDGIIVKDFSRFSRDYIETGDYLEQIFPFLGVRFISVNDRYDSAIQGSLAGDIGNGFKNLYNSYYSKDISRKVRSGLQTKKQSGTYTPSNCLYGYKKKAYVNSGGNRAGIGMEVDEEAATVVKRIFEMRIKGVSVPKITRTLNLERIPSPLIQQRLNGSKFKSSAKSENPLWSVDKVRSILHDIRYTGVFAYNMCKSENIGSKATKKLPMEQWSIISDAIPVIISADIFEKVNEAKNVKSKTNKSGGKGKYPLAGKLVCGGCGYSLKRNESRQMCRCARNEFISNKGCVEAEVSLKNIEDVLCLFIQQIFNFYNQHNFDSNEKPNDRTNEVLKEIQGIQRQLKSAHDKKTTLYDRYYDEELTRDEYIRLRDNEDKVISELNSKLAELESRQAGLYEQSASASEIVECINGLSWNGNLTKEISNALIKQVTIYDGSRMEIKWTFEDVVQNISKDE